MVPTFLGITLLTFALTRLAPGDPLWVLGEAGAMDAFALARLREQHGLDRPLPVQYLRWVGQVATFELGRSLQDGRPVATRIAQALPTTMLLALLSLGLSYLVAVPLGTWAALKRGGRFDAATTAAAFVLYAVPPFWAGVMLLQALATERGLPLFPLHGLGSPSLDSAGLGRRALDLLWHLVLPVAVLSYASTATLSRYARAAVLEVLEQDFIRTARAKGLTEGQVLWRHALPNAAGPLVALLGTRVPALVGGSVLVEQIFGIGGMGLLALEAISARDYPVVMGVTTVIALVTMGAFLVADLLHAAIDPRVRQGLWR
jgi:peptide/nickel transport system permease protein